MRDPEYPESSLPEHRELREILTRAMNAGGRTALAADGVRRVLYPHMRLEEAFAAPPLSLLPKLAAGEITPEMEKIIEVSAMLKLQLPRMLEQHRTIVTVLKELLRAASEEQHPPYVQFAQKLMHHAQQEEEMLYPAAILVGEYLKLKFGK
ncbi:MAG: hemerythrin domain-containing protein [Acidobacteriota bacterium]